MIESVNLKLFSPAVCLTHALGNYSLHLLFIASLSSIPVIFREALMLLLVAGCDFP